MKFLLILIFCFSANAANFMRSSYVDGTQHFTDKYSNQYECVSLQGEACIDVPFDFHWQYHVKVPEIVNDLTKPNYEAKSSVVACVDEADCIEKLAAQVCDYENSYYKEKSVDNTEVYCTKFLGYDPKESGREIVVIDEDLKAAYEAAELVKKSKEAAIQTALKAINCGKRVIATLVVQNFPKGLTTTQVKAINATYSTIKDLLETGSLVSAREEILAVTVDGVLVVEADKTALVSELDSCSQ